jgi:cytochrome c peroxidase
LHKIKFIGEAGKRLSCKRQYFKIQNEHFFMKFWGANRRTWRRYILIIFAFLVCLTPNTPNSRFDRFLQGDKQALTKSEQEGYKLFKNYGCISCHQGINVGGNMFQRFGVMGNYFADWGNITQADLGRFNVTKEPTDRYVFRVPSLRNVELTPPYFHDGSAETIEKAIAIMTKYQLGRPLSKEKIDLIAQFLRTLTGEYRGN